MLKDNSEFSYNSSEVHCQRGNRVSFQTASICSLCWFWWFWSRFLRRCSIRCSITTCWIRPPPFPSSTQDQWTPSFVRRFIGEQKIYTHRLKITILWMDPVEPLILDKLSAYCSGFFPRTMPLSLPRWCSCRSRKQGVYCRSRNSLLCTWDGAKEWTQPWKSQGWSIWVESQLIQNYTILVVKPCETHSFGDPPF